MKWASTHINWITDPRHVVLKQISRKPANDPENQDDQRNTVLVKSDRISESFDWERAESIDFLVPRAMSLLGGGQQFLWRIEFGHQSVNGSIFRGIDR